MQPPSAKANYLLGLKWLILTLCFFIGISLLFVHFNLDRKLIAGFYDGNLGWYLASEQPWHFLYQYGTVPGLVLTLACFSFWVLSLVKGKWQQWRKPLLLVFLTSIIGGGILVNAVLKPNWGRPRPRQVTDFGGLWQYREALSPGIPDKGNSFTCGHCTMGFIFCSLIFFWPNSRKLAIGGLLTGLTLGTLLTLARNIQGAHFITDGLWSLAVLTMTAIILYFFVLRIPLARGPTKTSTLSKKARYITILATIVALAIMVTAFLTRRPYYKSDRYALQVAHVKTLIIHTSLRPNKTKIKFVSQNTNQIVSNTRGFGWVNGKQYTIPIANPQKNTFYLLYVNQGYFSEIEREVEVRLAKELEGKLTVKFKTPPG